MNIAIFGVGGVGGYFGAKICRAREIHRSEVYFVARGAHVKAILDRGLEVRTSSEGVIRCRPTLATSDIDELPPLDGCLICVKSFDLEGLTRRLASRISAGTEIVPLLNGIDISQRIRENLAKGIIYPGCAFIGSHIVAPGVVSQDGGACRILFGNSPHAEITDPPALLKVFQASSILAEWHENIAPSLWGKFLFIAPFGLVTACFDATLGQVMESPHLSSLVRSIMGEMLALAAAEGIKLPGTIIEDSYQKGRDFPPETKTSFQRDFEVPDKPDERDLFAGAIIRLGRQHGIATPHVCELFDRINARKPWTGA